MSFELGKPINNSSEDILSRSKFAKSIANSINNYKEKDMIALGLNGSWGTGKSSTINLIKEKIDKEKYDIVEFNPWYYSSRKQLITDFFEQISLVMGKNTENSEIAKTLKKYGKLLSATSTIPFPPLAFLKIIGDTAQGFGDFIKEQEDDAKENISTVKENLNENLDTSKKKILIIIDEIDRLENDDIKEIFQLVRALGDLSNIVYFLSYDIEVIKKAFDNKEKYIDKIINVQFDIPKANSEDFFNYLCNVIEKSYVNEINAIRDINYEGTIDLIKDIGFNNLREVNKLLNFFKITYNPIKNDVNFADYLLLCFIRCQNPISYETLYIHKDNINNDIAKDDEILKKVIKVLKIKEKESKIHKRLIDPKYCNTYFEYNFKNGDLNAEALLSKEYQLIEKNLENYDYLVNFVKNFDEIFLLLDDEAAKFYLFIMVKKLAILREPKKINPLNNRETLQKKASKNIINLCNRTNEKVLEDVINICEIKDENELEPILSILEAIKIKCKKNKNIANAINKIIESYLKIKVIDKEIYKAFNKLEKLDYNMVTYIQNCFERDERFIELLKIIGNYGIKQYKVPIGPNEDDYELENVEECEFFMENIPNTKYLNENIIKNRIEKLSEENKVTYAYIIKEFKNRRYEFEENEPQDEEDFEDSF